MRRTLDRGSIAAALVAVVAVVDLAAALLFGRSALTNLVMVIVGLAAAAWFARRCLNRRRVLIGGVIGAVLCLILTGLVVISVPIQLSIAALAMTAVFIVVMLIRPLEY